jgi:DNA-binding NarL/FixJ family response regulator
MQTVLIVDDHPAFRGWARAVLQAEGFGVVGEAADGAAAIQAVRALRPDVVLLDVQLPDMDGFEVAARLRRDEASGAGGMGGMVVLISSRDAADYGTRVSSSPAAGFLAKADLSGAALAALLDRAGQGPEPRR